MLMLSNLKPMVLKTIIGFIHLQNIMMSGFLQGRNTLRGLTDDVIVEHKKVGLH